MCRLKVLCDSHFGAIFQCEQCRRCTVAFGTVSLNLTLTEFDDLCEKATSGVAYFEPRVEGPHIKQIPFWQVSEFATIVLNLDELRQLDRMLQKAKSKIVASELIARFPMCQS
jgi:hypothetical protein